MSETLQVVHVEAGRHLYGGGLQVLYLMEGLAGAGHGGLLVCPPGSEIGAAARRRGLAVAELPMNGDLDPGLVRRLGRLLAREQPDLVHLHSRRGADLWGALAARRRRLPVVLSRRVDNPEWGPWARRKYRLYDHVVAISAGIRRVLLAGGVDPGRVSCVPSAVDLHTWRPGGRADARRRLRERFGVPADAPLAGMVAQLIPRKGHGDVLKALPDVLAVAPELRVICFGRGPLEAGLSRQIAAAGLQERMILGGYVGDLPELMPGFDLLVHPAHMEGLGVALLQGAACALPLVATPVGGIPEIVVPGETGTLVPAGDPAALARAVLELVSDPALAARLGAAARARVEARFSVPAMVEGNLAVYRRVLAERRAGR